MALNIKNPVAERLAQELARETGESPTEAVTVALRERLEARRRRQQPVPLLQEVAALQAFLRGQPDRDARPADAILAAAILLARKAAAGEVALDALLQRLGIEVVPMTAEAATLARGACQRFGKGVGAPGVLSHGDCLACGVAMAAGEPLLLERDDFPRTDVVAVAL